MDPCKLLHGDTRKILVAIRMRMHLLEVYLDDYELHMMKATNLTTCVRSDQVPDQRIIFVTRQTFTGVLVTNPGAIVTCTMEPL